MSGINDGRDGRPWHITGARVLTLGERLRVLFGTRVYARFRTPDGQCHAGCEIDFFVQRDWPREDQHEPWLHKAAGQRSLFGRRRSA